MSDANKEPFIRTAKWAGQLVYGPRTEDSPTFAAVRLYLYLCDGQDKNFNTCQRKQETIADRIGSDVRTVRRAIKELESLGMIEVIKRGGRDESSKYKIIYSAPNQTTSDKCSPDIHVPLPDICIPITGHSHPVDRTSTSQKPDFQTTLTPDTATACPQESKGQSRSTIKNNFKKDIQATSEKKTSRVTSEDKKLAEYLLEKIEQVAPRTKQPDLNKWADKLRLMREQDDIPLDEIRSVFDWANADSFWKTNILSPSKLREKYARLHAQMTSPQKGNTNGRDGNNRRTTFDKNKERTQTPIGNRN